MDQNNKEQNTLSFLFTKEQAEAVQKILPQNYKIEFFGKKSNRPKKNIQYNNNKQNIKNKKQMKLKQKQQQSLQNIITLTEQQILNSEQFPQYDEDGYEIFDAITTKNTNKNSNINFNNQDKQSMFKDVIQKLVSQKYSYHFLNPDFEVPDHMQDIDLQIIQNKVELKCYKNVFELKSDLERMFELFYLNNKRGSLIYQYTLNLQSITNSFFNDVQQTLSNYKLMRLNKEYSYNSGRNSQQQIQKPQIPNLTKKSVMFNEDTIQTVFFDNEASIKELSTQLKQDSEIEQESESSDSESQEFEQKINNLQHSENYFDYMNQNQEFISYNDDESDMESFIQCNNKDLDQESDTMTESSTQNIIQNNIKSCIKKVSKYDNHAKKYNDAGDSDSESELEEDSTYEKCY